MSQVVRPDPLDGALLLLLFEQRVSAEVGRLVRSRRHRRRLVRGRRQVLGHGVLELFHGVRIARGRPLVAAVRFRWTGRQRGLTRRRGGAQAGEMLFPTHRHVLFRTATAAVSRRRRHRRRGRFVPVGDFPFVCFPFVVARLFRLYSYAVVVVIIV